MNRAQLISAIHEVLEKYQFRKKGAVWNRVYGDFVDVIDLQVSKSKETFTINVGVCDKFVMHVCWNVNGEDVVQESLCTVRARLGELLDGRDVWWNLSDNDSLETVLNGLLEAALPFLQHNHSIENMIGTLEKQASNKRYPPGVIYLALLYYEKGDGERFKEILNSVKLTGPWGQKVHEIVSKIGAL